MVVRELMIPMAWARFFVQAPKFNLFGNESITATKTGTKTDRMLIKSNELFSCRTYLLFPETEQYEQNNPKSVHKMPVHSDTPGKRLTFF